jgi:hypothetical protein
MAWNKIGSVRKSKSGGLYIKVDKAVTLKEGQSLQLQDPRKSIQASIENGKLSQEKGEEMLAKLPDYIRQDVFLVTDN